jgi:hypothetical protein
MAGFGAAMSSVQKVAPVEAASPIASAVGWLRVRMACTLDLRPEYPSTCFALRLSVAAD